MALPASHATGMSIFSPTGERKYLTRKERAAFLNAAKRAPGPVNTLCMTLAFSGCRISEALALTSERVDVETGVLVFESLKKRRDGVYRAVPVPPELFDTLDRVHSLGREHCSRKLWIMSRMTAWRRITEVMRRAGLRGAHASPKGLRHGFGVAAVEAGVPLHLVQRWLGHAHIATTAIYADVVGAEERSIAARMWTQPSLPTGQPVRNHDSHPG